MTYQTAKDIGEIIVTIGPQLVVISFCIGFLLSWRKHIDR